MSTQTSQPGQDANICAQCHQGGGGCCRLAGGDVRAMFGLTAGEVALIAQASGLPPARFVVVDMVEPEFLADIVKIHPLLGQTMPHGRRLRLRVDGGVCCFLGPAGCTLPTQARPLYCRLYPFWFTPDGRLMVLGSARCLAQKNAISWKTVLKRMGEDIDRLRQLFLRLEDLAARHEAAGGLILEDQA